jgi:hypothetical protein
MLIIIIYKEELDINILRHSNIYKKNIKRKQIKKQVQYGKMYNLQIQMILNALFAFSDRFIPALLSVEKNVYRSNWCFGCRGVLHFSLSLMYRLKTSLQFVCNFVLFYACEGSHFVQIFILDNSRCLVPCDSYKRLPRS